MDAFGVKNSIMHSTIIEHYGAGFLGIYDPQLQVESNIILLCTLVHFSGWLLVS